MEYNIGIGKSSNPETCVQEATARFRKPKLILFFSPVAEFDKYTEIMHQRFPDSICMGATSIAMFSHDGAEKNVLKAVGIESGIRCSADVLEDVDKYPIKYVERVKRCVDEVRDTRNTICLEFTTTLLCAEESVLSALNTILIDKGIPVFGGTAGDTGTATGTKVSLNGRVCERSSVFAIIHNEGGAIKVFRENIYKPVTGNILTATKADGLKRTVFEYNKHHYMFHRKLTDDEYENLYDAVVVENHNGSYSYDEFCEKSGIDKLCLYLCLENNKLYIPCEKCLLLWMGD